MENNNVKDGEILFLYEAKLTNPNGDIDDENRPRMDYDTFTNLVSDVRLKRYIRDYLQDDLSEDKYNIFINHGDVQTAKDRLMEIVSDDIFKDIKKARDAITQKFIDIRMFGAMVPIPKKGNNSGESGSGDSIKIIGPVQFSWGYSLNKVQLLNSYSITSGFSSSEGNKMNSIGKDYRVYYSLIGFYGVISSSRAKKANLTSEDMRKLDDAMIKAIPSQATRSKINQMPLLYMRTESENGFIGDLRDYVKISIKSDPIRNINDYKLDINDLISTLKSRDIKIAKSFVHEKLDCENKDGIKNISNDD
ncbi:type I-B CRISPR-associated protein Cas7/Csh2 [Ferroplasma acidiphilum]|jgi:CRISPR-associated protein Csh2|uniref:type I-B CRISPR-associated protein Cas7/Csh2 n=1 Tax=Ferroplasma acidiphilum TaxID=74969 RepID=UPI002815778C|nr:type I-B CRISPR-associated protein Cas7/Csh2 [Ferroplasma acidiphilum]WMT53069.1 MAG: type I-B CRISPR-associated protein Cas7/Csh2 [Ferroplasma acidiphilum]